MSALRIRQLSLGPIGTNCYVVNAEGSSSCFVVDPGAEADHVLEVVGAEELSIEGVLVTHCHWDHIGAVAPVAQGSGAPVWMSRMESFVLEQDPNRFVPQGLPAITPWPVQHKLDGGERLDVAGVTLAVLPVPGHSPGSMAFYVEGVRDEGRDSWRSPPVLFVGDLIFQGSVGRTDLPGADHATLVRSVQLVLSRCPDDTIVLSGHGPATTLGAERRQNPFLRGI